MKKHLFLLGLLATSSTCAYAIDRPDGILGTNAVTLYGMYVNVNQSKQQANLDLDYSGIGVNVNQNLFDNGNIGMDVSFDISRLSNQNQTDIYSIDEYQYGLSATVYRDGAISPYFKGSAIYDFAKIDFKSASAKDMDEDAVMLAGEIGAECHLLPGWAVTPYVVASVDTDAEDDAWTTIFGVKTCYWISSRLGVQIDAEYYNQNDSDIFFTSLGASYHY